MAHFSAIAADVEGASIRLRFELDKPCVVGWQLYDPATGAFLLEGDWKETADSKVDVRIALPEESGPYRVQVAPVEDRARFILIDTQVAEGKLEMSPPRVITEGSLRRERWLRAIPKAFVY